MAGRTTASSSLWEGMDVESTCFGCTRTSTLRKIMWFRAEKTTATTGSDCKHSTTTRRWESNAWTQACQFFLLTTAGMAITDVVNWRDIHVPNCRQKKSSHRWGGCARLNCSAISWTFHAIRCRSSAPNTGAIGSNPWKTSTGSPAQITSSSSGDGLPPSGMEEKCTKNINGSVQNDKLHISLGAEGKEIVQRMRKSIFSGKYDVLPMATLCWHYWCPFPRKRRFLSGSFYCGCCCSLYHSKITISSRLRPFIYDHPVYFLN